MWKTVPQHPHLQAHTDGRIRNAETGRVYAVKVKPDTGYLTTRVLGATHRVHRLVAMAHIPNPDGKPHVNHLDFDRTNARASNLEWCTPLENHTHSRLAGRFEDADRIRADRAARSLTGDERAKLAEKCRHRKAITNDVETFLSIKAAIRAGYSREGLRRALRKGGQHHGRHWRYMLPGEELL